MKIFIKYTFYKSHTDMRKNLLYFNEILCLVCIVNYVTNSFKGKLDLLRKTIRIHNFHNIDV